MTENEFELLKRRMITIAEQIKLTGEIPKPFERKKYYDPEKQRVFLGGVSYGLNIALNILTYAVDSTRDESWKAQRLLIIEELSPERLIEVFFSEDEAMEEICSWRKKELGGCPLRNNATDDDCKKCVKRFIESNVECASKLLSNKLYGELFFGGGEGNADKPMGQR